MPLQMHFCKGIVLLKEASITHPGSLCMKNFDASIKSNCIHFFNVRQKEAVFYLFNKFNLNFPR